jgi:hypothetical protein
LQAGHWPALCEQVVDLLYVSRLLTCTLWAGQMTCSSQAG